MSDPSIRAAALVAQLRAQGDQAVRNDLAVRYGIHVAQAAGVPMRRMKAIAKPLAPDQPLAEALWGSGLYEARILAVFVADPALVDGTLMNRWCDDFDNWAIVDAACFHLFDKTAEAWDLVDRWTCDERRCLESRVKRATRDPSWARR